MGNLSPVVNRQVHAKELHVLANTLILCDSTLVVSIATESNIKEVRLVRCASIACNVIWVLLFLRGISPILFIACRSHRPSRI